MTRRKRPARTGAAPRQPDANERLRAPLTALFPAGLPAPPPPPPPPPRLVSEEELMATAFAALETGAAIDFATLQVTTRLRIKTCPKVHIDKFPADPPARAVTPPERPPPRAPVPEVAALRTRAWAGTTWRDDPVRAHDHARAAADLIARARRGRLPTLRLRGLRREPALDALAAFVARERAVGARYVRIVTGKGLGSPGDPVLKEALAGWCASAAGDAHVAALAPELDVRGEYGAVILQLRPTS